MSLTAKSRSSRMDVGGGDMDWLRGKVFLKPDDQLQLSEAVGEVFFSKAYYSRFYLRVFHYRISFFFIA